MVKNTAPQKQGVKNGLLELDAHPIMQDFLFSQLLSSIKKFVQAKIVPPSKIKNCVVIIFFIYFIILCLAEAHKNEGGPKNRHSGDFLFCGGCGT